MVFVPERLRIRPEYCDIKIFRPEQLLHFI